MSVSSIPIQRSFTGIRLTLQSSQPYDETERKLVDALNAKDFTPGKLMIEGAPVIKMGGKAAFEEFIASRAGRYGFV